ncbi:hypothetical protein [Streptomyces sp. NPDC047097]|uniref:hypothetical protein n=1 Tax=Streptomyces sp. NPDC047097 TaxID=3155260 RepID=UPI0033E4392C
MSPNKHKALILGIGFWIAVSGGLLAWILSGSEVGSTGWDRKVAAGTAWGAIMGLTVTVISVFDFGAKPPSAPPQPDPGPSTRR